MQANGGNIQVEMSNPHALLYASCKCQKFANLMSRTMRKFPSSLLRPWNIILYNDEANVGNRLKQDNKRTLVAVYWSFVEFGPVALSKEDFWMVAATVKANTVHKVDAGISQVLAEQLKCMFEEDGRNFRLAGTLVELPDSTPRVFAKFRAMFGDESALHQAWNCKGASGVKLCVQCFNIVSSNWKAADEVDGGPDSFFKLYTHQDEIDPRGLHTKATIAAIQASLDHDKPLLSKKAFEAKGTALGFSFTRAGLLKQRALVEHVDPCTQNVYDWPHTILQGVLPQILYQFFRSISLAGLQACAQAHAYLQLWSWPRAVGGEGATAKEIFNPKRVASDAKAKTIKLQMSEGLSLFPVLQHWVRQTIVPSGSHAEATEAMLAWLDFIELLYYQARANVTPAEFTAASTRFLRLAKQAFGTEWMIPKAHFQLHFGKYLEDFFFAFSRTA